MFSTCGVGGNPNGAITAIIGTKLLHIRLPKQLFQPSDPQQVIVSLNYSGLQLMHGEKQQRRLF